MGCNRFTDISSSSSVNNGFPALVAKMPVIVCSELTLKVQSPDIAILHIAAWGCALKKGLAACVPECANLKLTVI
jgi:hypothetical protein